MPREGITEKVTLKSRPQGFQESKPCRYLGKSCWERDCRVLELEHIQEQRGGQCDQRGVTVRLKKWNQIQNIENLAGLCKDWITWSEIETSAEFWHRAYMIWLLSEVLFLLHFNLIEKLPRNKLLGLNPLSYKLWSHQPCSIACTDFCSLGDDHCSPL